MGQLRKSIWFAIVWIWVVQSGHAVESQFVFSDLQASPQEINVLQDTLITVSVTNAGSTQAAGQAELKVDDAISSKCWQRSESEPVQRLRIDPPQQ